MWDKWITVGGSALLVSIAVLAFSGPAKAAVTVNDTCDLGAGNEAGDIQTVRASYDALTGEVAVEITLCGVPDPATRIRYSYTVESDDTAPFFDDPDRNGDGVVDATDFCATTTDNTMTLTLVPQALPTFFGPPDFGYFSVTRGIGQFEQNDDTLTLSVPIEALNPLLGVGDTIYISTIASHRGIVDRAPNTESGDGCSKTQVATEVLALTLAPPGKTVFVTSAAYPGNLGGLAGADAICQSHANAAGLGGTRTYKAWLADNTGSPHARFNKVTVPYIRVDGVQVASSYLDLATCPSGGPCLESPINVTEIGTTVYATAPVWTDVNSNGFLYTPQHCSNWSLTSGNGYFGRSDSQYLAWTAFNAAPCYQSKFLYCFEQ